MIHDDENRDYCYQTVSFLQWFARICVSVLAGSNGDT